MIFFFFSSWDGSLDTFEKNYEEKTDNNRKNNNDDEKNNADDEEENIDEEADSVNKEDDYRINERFFLIFSI